MRELRLKRTGYFHGEELQHACVEKQKRTDVPFVRLLAFFCFIKKERIVNGQSGVVNKLWLEDGDSRVHVKFLICPHILKQKIASSYPNFIQLIVLFLEC